MAEAEVLVRVILGVQVLSAEFDDPFVWVWASGEVLLVYLCLGCGWTADTTIWDMAWSWSIGLSCWAYKFSFYFRLPLGDENSMIRVRSVIISELSRKYRKPSIPIDLHVPKHKIPVLQYP